MENLIGITIEEGAEVKAEEEEKIGKIKKITKEGKKIGETIISNKIIEMILNIRREAIMVRWDQFNKIEIVYKAVLKEIQITNNYGTPKWKIKT